MPPFVKWLQKNVVEHIDKSEALSEVPLPFVKAVLPFPSNYLPIYTAITLKDAERIKRGKTNPLQLSADERYALAKSGSSLIGGTGFSGLGLLKKEHKRFKWCYFQVPNTRLKKGLVFVKLFPKDARYVHVVDVAVGKAYKKQCLTIHSKLTDNEIRESVRLVAETRINICNYKDNYINPLVCLGRQDQELSFDEVELL